MKFCFIVLHFQNIEDTRNCVFSILNNVQSKYYKIIIVDNSSPNNSGEILEELYKNDIRIDIIFNSKNLGYAKGNNIGGKFAVKKYHPDFICVLNNDTEINQNNFIDTVIKQYNKERFHFLGPNILTKSGSQNPIKENIIDYKSAKRAVMQTKRLLILNYLFLDQLFLKYIEIKHHFLKRREADNTKFQKNVGLHGACIIFSKDYIYSYPNLFYDKTFLYMEENILSHIRRRDNLVSIYLPELEVYHKEDGSTNLLYKRNYLKRRNTYKHRLQSIYSFIELLNNPNLFSKI